MRILSVLSVAAFLTGALFTTAHAGGTLEAYTGAIGGSHECGGGAPSVIYPFFTAGQFGIPVNPMNPTSLAACGDVGGVNYVAQSTGTASSAYALNTPVPGPANFTANTAASAKYGIVTVGAVGTLSPDIGADTAEAVAFGRVTDELAFNPNGTGNGVTGYVVLHFTFNGSLEMAAPYGTGDAAVEAVAEVGAPTYPAQDVLSGHIAQPGAAYVAGIENGLPGQPVPGCVTATGSITCTNAKVSTTMYPVAFYTPTPVEFGLYVGMNPGPTVSTDPPGGELTGITLYNAAEQEISNFTITSASGAKYGADGIEAQPAVPEPATWAMLIAGVTGVGAVLRRRREIGLVAA
jgi:hypothetical protein